MKNVLGGVLILLSIAALASNADDESDVILQAQLDAKEDGSTYTTRYMGCAGCAVPWLTLCIVPFVNPLMTDGDYAGAIAAPVLTGVGTAFIGYSTGEAKVPDWRIVARQEKHADQDLLLLYESEYTRTLTKIQHCKRGNAALLGFGVGVAGFIALGFVLASAFPLF
jgi:hypothetical protein